MFDSLTFYYFSPTGGTKKAGGIFCGAAAEKTEEVDLLVKSGGVRDVSSDAPAVIAVPVFGGRIPATAADRLREVDGRGRQAVTLVVYGNRAYEDALLELNDIAAGQGFHVAASGALIAQHSMAPEVGKGRPDEADQAEIREFADRVAEKIGREAAEKKNGKAESESSSESVKPGVSSAEIRVPGNRPYKEGMNMPAAPVCMPSCGVCGVCADVCPEDAVKIQDGTVVTDPEACILCMACAAACPSHARILPPPLQERTAKMLSPLAEVRRENEFFF